jgi:hypothetical protein
MDVTGLIHLLIVKHGSDELLEAASGLTERETSSAVVLEANDAAVPRRRRPRQLIELNKKSRRRKGNKMPCPHPSYCPCPACLMWHSAAPHLQPISRVANGITMRAAISIPSTARRHGNYNNGAEDPGDRLLVPLVQGLLLQECFLAERAYGHVALAVPTGWALRHVVQV